MTAGSDIAGFRVLADLGAGAASRLFCVQDPKTKQIWALKQVTKETEKDQRFLDQTEIEFTVGSQLDHPNIRRVHRLIKNRRVIRVTEMILLMELIDGVPLDRHPPDSPEVAADIFQQVADALCYMHQKGFVHADMKPNNVIVMDLATPKIIDLGQSCRIGTVKERIQGTVDYIAPEQVHRQSITPATDVYNLGATMYWCLTGTHIPTAMSDRTGLGYAKAASQLERPKPPSELCPAVPEELSELVLECVRPEPKERPNMESVRNRLQIIHVRLASHNGVHLGDGVPADDETDLGE